MEKNLKNKAIRGVKWTSLSTLFTAITSPSYQIILALLLMPGDFAYIAIISLFVGISTLFSDIGIGEAIIQKDYVSNENISSLFYFNTIITSIIAIIFFLLAPLIHDFYNLQNLDEVIKLLIITVIFNGFSSVFRVYAQRELLFGEIALIQIVKTSVDILLSTYLIWIGNGIMGYVYGTIMSSVINTILFVFLAFKKTNLKILFYFSIKDILPFLNFGLSISLKKILTYLSQRLDEIIIGGNLSSDILGIYYFGKRLVLQLQTVMTSSFSRVLLPVFSRIKNNNTILKNAYMKITYLASLVGFPMFAGLASISNLLIPVIFGNEWMGSAQVVSVLSLAMIFQVLTANIATSMLYSINRPNLVLAVDIVTNSLYLLILVFFSYKGVEAILLLFTMYIVSKAIILQYVVGKELGYDLLYYIGRLKYVFFSTLAMCTTVLLLNKYMFSFFGDVSQLIAAIITGIVSYISIQWWLDKDQVRNMFNSIKKRNE